MVIQQNLKIFITVLAWVFQNLIGQDYTLNDCIKIALNQKKTILSASLDVASAEKSAKASLSGVLPVIQIISGASQNRFPERETISYDLSTFSGDTLVSNKYDNLSAGVSLNQMVYDGGRSRTLIQQARTNLDIAHLNKRLIKINVIQKVIQSYYNLLQAQKLYNVSEKNLEMSMDQVSFVEKQFELGVVKKTDLLKANVAYGQARVESLNKKVTYENSRRVLFNDMGLQDFGQKVTAMDKEWITPKIPSKTEVLKSLKENNPSIAISKKQIKVQDLSIKLAKGLRMPFINSSVNYSANGENSEKLISSLQDDWSLGLNLSFSFPIYSGNSLLMQQQQASINKQRSEYDYITLLNDLRVQAELIREILTNYVEIIPINQEIVISAEEDLKLVTERYSLGSATILEVLDAQVSLMRSKSSLINTIHDARIQEASLNALLGILDKKYQ
jgi:outer membrane protein